MSVLLVTVVSGEAYARYAKALGESADEFFHPSDKTGFLVLEGREGWPAATLYRYHVLLEHQRFLRDFDHVFLCDADMRFENQVGSEVLGALVATQHPGYVTARPKDLPFERNVQSEAFVKRGSVYHAGGFVGGDLKTFTWLARQIVFGINVDDTNEVTAVWHDESHLNHVLAVNGPSVLLPPSYCYPDDDSGYALGAYERKLVALDKTPAERGAR